MGLLLADATLAKVPLTVLSFNELRHLIADREEDFARGFTEHLIQSALGHPFGFTDKELANEIIHAAQNKEFPVSQIIHALVQSSAFRTK